MAAEAGARPPLVSVVMPTFEQARFIERAVASLRAQTYGRWELVIVDDGSQDNTAAVVRGLLGDPRIRCLRWDRNRGLGAAVNAGLDAASGEFVAYLPSDDVYLPAHLRSLVDAMRGGSFVACAGVRHRGREWPGAVYGHGLQMVQVMHRVSGARWIERSTLETDDLDRLFWASLRKRGSVCRTGKVTCEWRDHPDQRHKHIRESHDGGLNAFRSRYRVSVPMVFHSTDSWPIDERKLYEGVAEEPRPSGGLRILVVGELGFNPERLAALEERGHELFGLWIPDPLGTQAVGPLPFGNVREVPLDDWRRSVRAIRPDVVYALLNWRAVPLAHAVLTSGLHVAFVWHFKEAPSHCIRRGDGDKLADLHRLADACIYSTAEERRWMEHTYGPRDGPERCAVIDGDLPGRRRFTHDRRPPWSVSDGETHTVVLGRPVGFGSAFIQRLASARIHVHLCGPVTTAGPHGDWRSWYRDARRQGRDYLHLHPHVPADRWVRDLSRYDAGWLHRLFSHSEGRPEKMTWNDLNRPARIPPLMAAGVPLVQPRTPGSPVAAETFVRSRGVGVLYRDTDEVIDALRDRARLRGYGRAAWERRLEHCFDTHVDRLLSIFRAVAS